MRHPFRIRRFTSSHDRSRFDCGVASLNNWLAKLSSQYERRDLARAYVAVREDSTHVLGYYSLSMHHVNYEALPADQAKGLPRIDVPVVLLGRLAVDKTVQRQGLGATLLLDALARCADLSQQIGVRAVEVDAVDEHAQTFYGKFGFTSLLDDERHLYLAMNTIRKLNLPEPAGD